MGRHHCFSRQNLCPRKIIGEFLDVIVRRVNDQFLWRSNLNDRAILHDCNTIGQSHRFVEIVRDKYDGLAQH